MKAEHDKDFDGPFIVGEEQLEKICSLLEKYVGNIEISVDCAGNISYYPESIKELLALDNPKGKEILNLKLDARSREPHKRASVHFLGTRAGSISSEYKIPDDTLEILRSRIYDIISGLRPWYNFIYSKWFSLTVSSLFWAGIGVWLFTTFPRGAFDNRPVDLIAFTFLVLAGVIVLLRFSVGYVLIKIRNWIFPSAVFLLGQGKTRFNDMEKLRWGVFVSFVVSLFSGVIIVAWQNQQIIRQAIF
ncbi:MAG: hypothetical protein ACLQT6_16810 [Desulfomonilaceae bacterium]